MNWKNWILIVLKLSWRGMWKNRRRMVLTMMTVVVGYAVILFLNAIATGGHEQMIEDAVSTNIAHIQVHEKGFWDNRNISYAIDYDKALIKAIKKIKGVEAATGRIINAGLLSYGENTYPAFVQGVIPGEDSSVSNIKNFILPGGSYLSSGDLNAAVLGVNLAKNLDVEVGSSVAIISQGFDGSIASGRFTVRGLFKSGNPEYDNNLMVMNFYRAKEVFSINNYVNSILIRINEVGKTNYIKKQIWTLFEKPDFKKNDVSYEVMGWQELMPELEQFIVMDDFSAYIFVFVLLMVVAFGILNTVQMSVFERTREFGIMLAVGTSPAQVRWIVLFESVFISLLGIFLGLIVGYWTCYYFTVNPIDYSSYTDELSVWNISTTIFPAKLTGLNVIVTGSLIFLLSFLFSIFPAVRASRLKPIEAIHHL